MLALGVIGTIVFIGGTIFTLTHKQHTPIPPQTLALIAKAEQGDVAAQYGVALYYEGGFEGLAQDPAKAMKWFHIAAGKNQAKAQFRLAKCYQEGLNVAKDEVESVKWFRKAAEQDNGKAQFELAYCYEHGRGVERNDIEAAKWYRKAAEQNELSGQFGVANCYQYGRGVAKDYVEAYAWHNVYSNRVAGAAVFMGPLAAKMSPQQLADAEKRTQELRLIIEAKTKASGQ